MLNFICRFVLYLLAFTASSICDGSDIVGFEDVKKGVEDQNIVLIDVRSREEVKSLGKIPGAYNFPGENSFELSNSKYSVYVYDNYLVVMKK